MDVFRIKFLLCTLALTFAGARQEDWKDIYSLFPAAFESENRLPLEQTYIPHYRDPIRRFDNVLKRQDVDAFQRAKLTLKSCASCCCTALYKPRNIILAPDVYITVMEVSSCNNICPGMQTCNKVASTVEWSKMGLPVNNTAIFTACTCVP